MAAPLTMLPSRPAQQRIEANGGWSNGDASFVGDDPADGAVISYYQPQRHLIGKLKFEVLDASGKVLETLPASKRPGINRVVWTMRAPAPHAPPAAQIAFNSTQGPRLIPGVYTVRVTSGSTVLTQPLTVVLDRRVAFDLKGRQAQFDAAMRVSRLFGRETTLVARINAVRQGADARAAALPDSDPLKAQLRDLSAKADVLRKEIVATKEGGAITGEERLREHTDQLYGAIQSYEGQPTSYQIVRIAVLEDQLKDISGRFDHLAATDLAARNADLVAHKLAPIAPPPPDTDDDRAGGGGSSSALRGFAFSLHPSFATETAAERD